MKVRIHPFFFIFAIGITFLGGIRVYLLSFCAVILHEFSHYAVARIAGAKKMSIIVMPYGAVLNINEFEGHLFPILLAGPFCNFVLAVTCLAVSWLVPELYAYLSDFCKINIAIAIINLLPAYPLDGGRLFTALCKSKFANFMCRAFTFLLGVGMILWFVFKEKTNYSLLTFGSFLLSYFFTFSFKKSVKCDANNPISSILKINESGYIQKIKVMENKRKIATLSPKEIMSLVLKCPYDMSVKEAILLHKTAKN